VSFCQLRDSPHTGGPQLDSHCTRDVRDRRHLPKSPHAHAQSSRRGIDPRSLCRIQDLPSLIPRDFNPISQPARHQSTCHRTSHASFIPRRLVQRVDSPSSGVLCRFLYASIVCGRYVGGIDGAWLRSSVDMQVDHPSRPTTAHP
jgi:hypothetical protein